MSSLPTPLHRLAEDARSSLGVPTVDAEGAAVVALVRRQGRASVNMKPGPCKAFLETGRSLNVFDWAEGEAARTGTSVEETLRARLGEWFDPRVDFEARAGAGRHFHYSALNVGGMGSPRYGRLCVVDRRRPGDRNPDPVWLAEDSLSGERFRDAAGALDWDRLGEWVAPCDLPAELAALKLASKDGDKRPIAERICCNDDYIEGLALDGLTREEVAEIRSETDAEIQRRALAALLSGAVPEEELDLDLHDRIRELADEHEIPWTTVTP